MNMNLHTKACFTLYIVILTLVMVYGGGLGDLKDALGRINGIANALGTEGKGEIDRGNGCVINWSFKGMLMGFEYKYMGICVDKCTGITATSMTQSKGGAIEHCMQDLFGKLAAKKEL